MAGVSSEKPTFILPDFIEAGAPPFIAWQVCVNTRPAGGGIRLNFAKIHTPNVQSRSAYIYQY
jgi:hypothetical protein